MSSLHNFDNLCSAAIVLPKATTSTPDAQAVLTQTPEQAQAEIQQSIDASMTILGAGLDVTELYILGSQRVNYIRNNSSTNPEKVKLPAIGGNPGNFVDESATQENPPGTFSIRDRTTIIPFWGDKKE